MDQCLGLTFLKMFRFSRNMSHEHKSVFIFPPSLNPLRRGGFYHLSNRIKNRAAPPETAPNVAPFLPAMAAPIAVAMPAVAAIRRASFSQDRRFPPPHNTIAVFICTSRKKFPVERARHVPHGGSEQISRPIQR